MNRFDHLLPLIDKIHLWYLGLIPSLATFMILAHYGSKAPMLLFIGGAAAISVYLVVIFAYDPPVQSLNWGVVAIADGPLFALASAHSTLAPWGFAVHTFLVDGTAIWAAILLLAIVSPLPTKNQRLAAVGFMATAVAATVWLFWPYLQEHLWGQWGSLFWITVGITEATAVRFPAFAKEEVSREGDPSLSYLLPLLLIWLASFIIGHLAYEYGWLLPR
ncbi:MAG: hypothetical protein Kow0080_31630 [Candidatus Promineifilaceae bacterium]